MSTLPQTALFSSRFRECAGRALLLPRRRPDQRTPLWQQRQRAADLLAVAAKYPTFPILLEASRECLQDVFDVPALREVLGQLRSRGRARRHRRHRQAEPDGAEPAVQLDRRLHVRGRRPAGRAAGRRAGARPRPAARPARRRGAARAARPRRARRRRARPAAAVRRPPGPQRRRAARRAAPGRRPDRRRGRPALRGRRRRAAWLAELLRREAGHRGRASPARRASPPPTTPPATATRSGARCRSGCRRRSPSRCRARWRTSSARYARTHGPFTEREVADRFGVPEARVARRARRRWRPTGGSCAASSGPRACGASGATADVLRQLRRRSLATLRREVEPVEPEALARFLPAWHGIPAERRGVDAVVEALGLLAGRADRGVDARARRARRAGRRLPAGAARRAVHGGRRRVGRRRGDRLDRRSGAALLRRPAAAAGAGLGGARTGPRARCTTRSASVLAERGRQLLEPAPGGRARARPTTSCSPRCGTSCGPARSPTTRWRRCGPSPGRRRPARRARRRPTAAGPAAARAGSTASDRRPAPAAGASSRRCSSRRRRRPRRPTPRPCSSSSATASSPARPCSPRASSAGTPSVYGVLKVLEERGQVRRGYFVSGLGAAQFALPGAVDRLRVVRERADEAIGSDGAITAPVVLAATDPAQPYGATLAWPESAGPPGAHRRRRWSCCATACRSPGTTAARTTSSRSRTPSTTARGPRRWPTSCAAGRLRRVEVRKVDGEPLPTSPVQRRGHRRRQGRRLHRRLPRACSTPTDRRAPTAGRAAALVDSVWRPWDDRRTAGITPGDVRSAAHRAAGSRRRVGAGS